MRRHYQRFRVRSYILTSMRFLKYDWPTQTRLTFTDLSGFYINHQVIADVVERNDADNKVQQRQPALTYTDVQWQRPPISCLTFVYIPLQAYIRPHRASVLT